MKPASGCRSLACRHDNPIPWLTLSPSRVADPHWFNVDQDKDPAFFIIADPDLVLDPGFWWPKLKKIESWKKKKLSNAIYLSPILYEVRPSYRRSLQLSKENIQQFKTWNFFTFFFFCGSFLPSWIRIRIWNADPDPATQINADPCGSGDGSGSAALSPSQGSMNSATEAQFFIPDRGIRTASVCRTGPPAYEA